MVLSPDGANRLLLKVRNRVAATTNKRYDVILPITKAHRSFCRSRDRDVLVGIRVLPHKAAPAKGPDGTPERHSPSDNSITPVHQFRRPRPNLKPADRPRVADRRGETTGSTSPASRSQ